MKITRLSSIDNTKGVDFVDTRDARESESTVLSQFSRNMSASRGQMDIFNVNVINIVSHKSILLVIKFKSLLTC